jgi:DNA polymerase (family 10)
LGICDHSKAAQYAGGLTEEEIEEQHREIDVLNQKLGPFKIFKGIECDILGDGSLDYDESVWKTFDFIVASVHSNLKMTEEKAMSRLLRAIENPYTTILGHPTGRLLLMREGYPVDHKKMIDACAANGVVIEINAHPYRLDLDWRHIDYALNKGVKLSINPDAHHTEGYHDMYFGVCVARKGGLSRDMCFNALSLSEIDSYFSQRKPK